MATQALSDPRAAWLARQLSRFEASSPAERAHLAAVLELLGQAAAPFSAECYDPGHVTASALLISRRERQVLLIRHPTLGRWLQPGGHVDAGDESVAAAAGREVFEESGLLAFVEPAPIDVDVHPIPPRGGRRGHRHFDVRFIATVAEAATPNGAEGIEGRWCDAAAARALVDDEGLGRMISKAVALGVVG